MIFKQPVSVRNPGGLLRILAFSCAFAVLPSSGAPAPTAVSSKDLCRLGKSQYASGDVLKAIQSLGKCVDREPRNREALVLLANASLEAGRFPEAVDAFAKAQALKPGDPTFLTSYLTALDGAGKVDEQVAVLGALCAKKPGDRKIAERFLAAVEAAGPAKHPEEYLSALRALAEFPNPDRIQLEKLAAAYLGLGAAEKAEAEYRGLLEKKPESPEYWAGLGASQAKSDPEAASECYRKAALYSDQAAQRQIFQSEGQRLSQVAKTSSASSSSNAQVSQKNDITAVLASRPSPSMVTPVSPAPATAAAPKAPAAVAAKAPSRVSVPAVTPPVPAAPVKTTAPAPVVASKTPAPAKPVEPPAPAFNLKAFQDSVYHAELEKRLTALHKNNAPAPVVVAVAPPAAAPSAPSLAAAEEKSKREKIAKEAEQKAKDDKAKQDELAAEEKVKQEKLAAEEKAKQDKLARDEKERIAREEERKRQEAEAARKLKEELDNRERLTLERRERYGHALALYNAGHVDSAGIVFKTVLRDSPSIDAFYYAGRISLARKEYSQALDQFAHGPQDKPDLDGLKGKALMGMGRNKDALQSLEAQYGKTRNDSLLEDLIALKRKNGDEAGAIGYLEKLADKRPGTESFQMELAVYFQKQGDKAKATDHYGKVLALNPNQADANVCLGLQYAAQADPAHAVPLLEKAVVAFPKRADLWKTLARQEAAMNRKDAAWEAYNKAFALAPDDLELAKGKLALALESGRSVEAGRAYEDVLKISPQDKEASMGLAKLRFKEGNFPAAEKHFRIACADSKDAQALSQFGRTLLEVKKIDEAAAVLQKAIDLGDKDVALHYDLARIRMEKGDLDWAEGLVKDLARKSPTDPEPMYWQGQVAIKRQQTAVAEEFFRKANRLKPAEGRYAEALARLLKEKDDFKTGISVLRLAEPDLTASGRLLYGDCLAMGGAGPRALEVYADLYKHSATALLLSRRMDLLVRMGKAEQAVELATAAPFMDSVEVQFSLAKAQLSLADTHVIKGDVDQAVDLMKKVVKHDDRNAESHYYLGLGYFGQNRLKKARDEFIEAITYRVDYPEALYRKGLCQIKLEDIKDAENSFGELSQHADAIWKARGLYGLALVFEAQGKPEAVEHHLERSIQTQPLPEAMAYLSRVRLKQGRVVEAEESAKQALMADPSYEEGTVALAEALAAAKRQSEAMELARQGLRAKPLSCGLLVQSAKLTFESGRLDSALAVSSNAIRLCPEEPMGYYYAGVSMHGSSPKEAKQYFKSFKKLGGDKKLVPEE